MAKAGEAPAQMRAGRMAPEDVRRFFDRAEAINDPHALLELADQTLAIFPDSEVAHYIRGTALHGAVRYGDAVSAFERAIDIRPDDMAAHVHRAMSLLWDGQIAEAISSYRNCLKLLGREGASYLLYDIASELVRISGQLLWRASSVAGSEHTEQNAIAEANPPPEAAAPPPLPMGEAANTEDDLIALARKLPTEKRASASGWCAPASAPCRNATPRSSAGCTPRWHRPTTPCGPTLGAASRLAGQSHGTRGRHAKPSHELRRPRSAVIASSSWRPPSSGYSCSPP